MKLHLFDGPRRNKRKNEQMLGSERRPGKGTIYVGTYDWNRIHRHKAMKIMFLENEMALRVVQPNRTRRI